MAKVLSSDSSSYALDRVRDLLEPSVVGPDRKLPTERALAERLGVSRRSIRRALEVLEAEGRIWRRQGAGTFVGPRRSAALPAIDSLAARSDVLDVMEARLGIEPVLAALAAERASTRDIERMLSILDRLAASEDSDSRELWDSALHRTIAESAGNDVYLAVFELIDRVRQNAAWIDLRARARTAVALSLYGEQHAAIIEAIAEKNANGAATAMRRHLEALRGNLVGQAGEGVDDIS